MHKIREALKYRKLSPVGIWMLLGIISICCGLILTALTCIFITSMWLIFAGAFVKV